MVRYTFFRSSIDLPQANLNTDTINNPDGKFNHPNYEEPPVRRQTLLDKARSNLRGASAHPG